MIEQGGAAMGARFVPVVELDVSGPSCPIDGAGDPYAGAIYPGAPIPEPVGLIFCHEHRAYCGAPVPDACYGLSSINPHPLGSRVADCPECPNFDDYRKCTTCGAATGEPCTSQSGRVVGGIPDGIRTPLPRPHVGRERRSGR